MTTGSSGLVGKGKFCGTFGMTTGMSGSLGKGTLTDLVLVYTFWDGTLWY